MRSYQPHNNISFIARLALCAAVALPLAGETIAYAPVAANIIQDRLHRAPKENPERGETLKKLFEEAGCKQLTEQPVKGSPVPNVICTLPGQEDSVVVVGAHFDKAKKGDGAADNWSGASLLPSLFQSLNNSPRHATFVFVGFTDEEKGQAGSKAYVKQLSDQDRTKIRAMVNVHTIGLAPTKVWAARANKGLLTAFSQVAGSLKMQVAGVDLDRMGSSDSFAFSDRKIPTIDVHSLTQETMGIPDSDKDKMEAIQDQEYQNTYKLLGVYLAYLDITLKSQPAAGTGK